MKTQYKPQFKHRIRSFVRREGRITKAQQRALQELFPHYGIESSETKLDMDALFGRTAPRVLEIGFGNGAALAEIAQQNPDKDYLGIEVHRPGVGNLLLQIEQQQIKNIRIFCADAVDVLTQQIPDASLDAVYLFFPDPWHKKRHHKRRLIQADFAQLIQRKLKPGGIFHMATDWQDYAEQAMTVLTQCEGFENTTGKNQYASKPDYRPLTKFELRGQRLGHGVWDIIFKRSC